MNRTIQITQEEYSSFQTAYDFFNRELFDSSLPSVLITLQRHSKAYGFLAPDKFIGRSDGDAVHELALNPDHFGRTDREILSTLVHEMCHVWQQTHGKPPRKSYHDREWSSKMKEIGLCPSSTGEPGGNETGAKVSHYVIESGLFSQTFVRLRESGFTLRWQSRPDNGDRQKKAASKTKYSCPNCEQNAWAKPDALLICGQCYNEDGEICVMESETKD